MSARRPRVPRVAVPDTAPERATPAAVEPVVVEPAPVAPAAPEAPAPPAPPGPQVIDLQEAAQRRRHEGTRPSSRPDAERAAAQRVARLREERRRAAVRERVAARRRVPLPEPVPARQITGRSLVVLAVLIIAAVLVAPTARLMLNQQLEISAAQQDIAEQQRRKAEYEEQIRRWDDPGYVAQQARQRLELVMPGETLYTVTGLPDESGAVPADSVPQEKVNDRLPWVEGLWDSAVRAATE